MMIQYLDESCGGRGRHRAWPVVLLCGLTFAVAACDDDGTEPDDPAHSWSYDGATGPQSWGTLSPDFALCSTGQTQSPIDLRIANTPQLDLPDLALRYQAA